MANLFSQRAGEAVRVPRKTTIQPRGPLAHNRLTAFSARAERDGKQRGRDQLMAKVLCVLYDDPVDGYPPAYARYDIPKIERSHDGQSAPTPESIGFRPGELLGSVSGELGLRDFLEGLGHELIVTSDKDGPDS